MGFLYNDIATDTIVELQNLGSSTQPRRADNALYYVRENDSWYRYIASATPTGTDITPTDNIGAYRTSSGSGGGSGTDDQTASEVPFTPTGNTTSNNVQDAIVEIQTEIDGLSGGGGTDDQTASEVPFTPTGNTTSTNVQDAIAEVQTDVDSIDISASNIKSLYESNADTNAFTDAEQTLLSTIETNADATDETNVVASLNGATLPTATVSMTDKVVIQDTDDSDNLKTVTAQSIADLTSGGGTDDQTAAEVPVTATPVNYTAATADVEAHLSGIDTVLASVGSGSSIDPERVNYTTNDEIVIPNKYFETSSGLYKPMYRKVIDLGNLPNSVNGSVAHGLTFSDIEPGSLFQFGEAHTSTTSLVLPYTDVNNFSNGIGIFLTSTNIEIRLNTDRSAFTASYTLEYAKVSDTEISL